jgi:single-strand DNA-binding protein
MDLNLVVISGRLAAPAELRTFDSGARLIRYLVTCRRQEPARRVDVVPVTLWDPTDDVTDLEPGTPVWVAGGVQRRFWESGEGRRSRLEVVADAVCVRPQEGRSPTH